MNKEYIEALAKLLTEIKVAANELELAVKNKDGDKGYSAKRKILELQNQISKII